VNIKDHEQAIKVHAAERYVLDELSPEERDDFEEHYFICVKCAEQVRMAAAFADNAKAVFREDAATATLPGVAAKPRSAFHWWAWLRPAIAAPIAAALLLTITLYQSVLVIPRLERDLKNATQARAIPSVVARLATRGEDPSVEVSEQDQFVQLILDIDPTLLVSSYNCEVYDGAGALRFAVPAPAPARGGSLNLLLPAAGLKTGRYVIRVRPSSGADSKSEPHLDEYSFVLRRKL